VTLRLLSYNIQFGGQDRMPMIASTINAVCPDVVLLQEATVPHNVERLARETGMPSWGSTRFYSLGYLSRRKVAHHEWHRPPGSRRPYLELVLADPVLRVFGIHLSAIHTNWMEERRSRELRATLDSIKHHQNGLHMLAGDFNTLAPGERLDLHRLPRRLRLLAWMGGRTIRWQTIQMMLDAGYADGFRALHPKDDGATFPTWSPHIRLDFVFMPQQSIERLKRCDVIQGGPANAASDHFPVVAEIEI